MPPMRAAWCWKSRPSAGFWHYVTTHAQREDWRFAPLHADDVDGVALAWVGLAECDPLVDEGIQYADKLRWQVWRWTWRSTAASRTNSSRWAAPFPEAGARPMPTQAALRQAFERG